MAIIIMITPPRGGNTTAIIASELIWLTRRVSYKNKHLHINGDKVWPSSNVSVSSFLVPLSLFFQMVFLRHKFKLVFAWILCLEDIFSRVKNITWISLCECTGPPSLHIYVRQLQKQI